MKTLFFILIATALLREASALEFRRADWVPERSAPGVCSQGVCVGDLVLVRNQDGQALGIDRPFPVVSVAGDFYEIDGIYSLRDVDSTNYGRRISLAHPESAAFRSYSGSTPLSRRIHAAAQASGSPDEFLDPSNRNAFSHWVRAEEIMKLDECINGLCAGDAVEMKGKLFLVTGGIPATGSVQLMAVESDEVWNEYPYNLGIQMYKSLTFFAVKADSRALRKITPSRTCRDLKYQQTYSLAYSYGGDLFSHRYTVLGCAGDYVFAGEKASEILPLKQAPQKNMGEAVLRRRTTWMRVAKFKEMMAR